MSTVSNNSERETNHSTDNEDNPNEERKNETPNCTYWVRHDAREFLTDPNGEIVNLARLTAYAEYGDEIHDKQIHHEIPLLKIDAPGFLKPLDGKEHEKFHARNPDSVEADGFSLLRTGE